jgi:DNA-binding beta-propeller fold protein YncE
MSHNLFKIRKKENTNINNIYFYCVVLFLCILYSSSCIEQKEEALNEIQEKTGKVQDKNRVVLEGIVETRISSAIPEETWGTAGKAGILFIRTIGESEAKDPNLGFYYPNDIAVDSVGDIFVLDSENHRIQKFNRNGAYMETIGREGEGPVEFMHPWTLDIDIEGNIVVYEPDRLRLHIISPDGTRDKFLGNVIDHAAFDIVCHPNGGFIARANIVRPYREGVPLQAIKCLKMYDAGGTFIRSFVDCADFEHNFTTNNLVRFEAGKDGSIYVSFVFQNRIEKYNSKGELLWRVRRPLSYIVGYQEGKPKTTGSMTETTVARNNPCSEGIAVDAKGRAWVLTLNRQLKGSEALMVATFMTGKRLVTKGDTSLRFTDAYKIEVFGSNGDLVDTIPLTHFADSINIFGDTLFLIDKYRGMQVYQYQILPRDR